MRPLLIRQLFAVYIVFRYPWYNEQNQQKRTTSIVTVTDFVWES